jgi:D-alanyl-D-alanine carboxypeptidase
MRQAVEHTLAPSINCAVAVRTACGTRFFSAGPANIGPETVHRIGSISKTYVGALMLMLENDGLLHLDDKVARWVDGVPNGSRITIRQLLTHRSGLFNPTNDPQVYASNRTWRPEEILAIVQQHAPLFAPGAQFSYSNANFLVAGLIAQAATGQRLSTLIHTRLLAPLGLKQTFFLPDDSLGNLRLAPAVDENGADVTNLNDGSWAWGAGTLVATPSDVAKWIESASATQLFDASSEARLLAPSPTDDPSYTAGLGIFVFQSNLGPLVGHDGYINGYQSKALYAPDVHVTVATFVDHATPASGPDTTILSNAVFGALFPQ